MNKSQKIFTSKNQYACQFKVSLKRLKNKIRINMKKTLRKKRREDKQLKIKDRE